MPPPNRRQGGTLVSLTNWQAEGMWTIVYAELPPEMKSLRVITVLLCLALGGLSLLANWTWR